MLLQDKITIVIGAASVRGIGRATARACTEQDARVTILGLDLPAKQQASAEIGEDPLGLSSF